MERPATPPDDKSDFYECDFCGELSKEKFCDKNCENAFFNDQLSLMFV